MKSAKNKVMVGIVLLALLITVFVQLPTSNAQTPPSLYSTGHTETTITLEWTAAVPPTLNYMNNYTVYYSPYGTNGPFYKLGVYPPAVQTVVAYGLTANTNYWFYVVANWGNIFGTSFGNSNTLEASTNLNPALHSSSVTQTTVSLSWIDYNVYSNLTSFQSYTVQIMPASGSWSTLTTITSQTDESYTVTGLSPGHTYSFQIYDTVAVSGVSNTFSSYSNTVTVTTVSPISATISSPSSSLDVGSILQITSAVNGGVPPYSYQWYVNDNPASGATSSTFTFSPSSSGSYIIYLTVTDSSGTIANSNTLSITVYSEMSPSISATATTITVGQSTQINASVNGGDGPYSYQWYVNGTPVSGATSASFTFKPAGSGTYSIYVAIKDSTGAISDSAPLTITVKQASIISPLNGNFVYFILGIIVVIIVIIAVIAVVFARRRSETQHQSEQSEPPQK
ncbi:MAG: PKD domain-containing protein [Candidatus Parvarchaeota archaeon]